MPAFIVVRVCNGPTERPTGLRRLTVIPGSPPSKLAPPGAGQQRGESCHSVATRTPYRLEQAQSGAYAGELLVGELDLAIAYPDLAPRRVDEQIADSPRPLSAAVAAAQHRPDARGHLLVVEGLADALFVWRDSCDRG
jgi:hypothetical protein